MFCLINVSYVHCIYIENLTQSNIPESGLDPVSIRSWVLFLDVQNVLCTLYLLLTLYIHFLYMYVTY